MPATVELRENGRVLYYVYSDPWTLADMEQVGKEATKLYDAASRKLHVYLDARKMKTVPTGVLRARNNPDMRHPNSGQIVIVGAARIIQVMAETVLKLTHVNRLKFYQDEQEGWAYLRSV